MFKIGLIFGEVTQWEVFLGHTVDEYLE